MDPRLAVSHPGARDPPELVTQEEEVVKRREREERWWEGEGRGGSVSPGIPLGTFTFPGQCARLHGTHLEDCIRTL